MVIKDSANKDKKLHNRCYIEIINCSMKVLESHWCLWLLRVAVTVWAQLPAPTPAHLSSTAHHSSPRNSPEMYGHPSTSRQVRKRADVSLNCIIVMGTLLQYDGSL